MLSELDRVWPISTIRSLVFCFLLYQQLTTTMGEGGKVTI